MSISVSQLTTSPFVPHKEALSPAKKTERNPPRALSSSLTFAVAAPPSPNPSKMLLEVIRTSPPKPEDIPIAVASVPSSNPFVQELRDSGVECHEDASPIALFYKFFDLAKLYFDSDSWEKAHRACSIALTLVDAKAVSRCRNYPRVILQIEEQEKMMRGWREKIDHDRRIREEIQKAKEAFEIALINPSQLTHHKAALLCAQTNMTDLAIRSYSLAIEAFYTNPFPDHRAFFHDCFALGNIHFQSQQWKEASIIYAKALDPRYLEIFEMEEKLLLTRMLEKYNFAFFNLVLSQRPDLLKSEKGTPFQNLTADTLRTLDTSSPLGQALTMICKKV